jgi:ornithine cyclodeaminase
LGVLIESLFAQPVAEPRLVPAADLARVLTPRLAIDAIADWLRGTESTASQRTVAPVAHGDLLLMPAESSQWVGVKLATVAPGNPALGRARIQGTYHLFDAETLTPRAVFDAAMLTALRTPAVSAVAADHLAPPGPARLVVFGTSVQAEAHVACLAEVRPLESLVIVGRNPQRTEELAGRLAGQGYDARWTTTAGSGQLPLNQALEEASIVATCTSASAPLLDGRRLAPSGLVIAIGSHSPEQREVDGSTLREAFIAVENRAAAWREYGDLVMARAEGAIGQDAIAADLRELVRDGRETSNGRVADHRAFFKSSGMGWEDLAVAGRAFGAATA